MGNNQGLEPSTFNWFSAPTIWSLPGLLLAVLLVGACGSSSNVPSPVEQSKVQTSVESTIGTTTTTTSPSDLTEQACPTYTLEQISYVSDASLLEISGAVWDPTDTNVVWVHEDSGNAADVVAINSGTGQTLSRHTLAELAQHDWEDMSVAVDPGGVAYLFIGDIGDNLNSRASVELIRLPLPAFHAPNTTLAAYETARLKPPEPANAEALLVDPQTGDVLVITKNIGGSSQLLLAEGIAFQPWLSASNVTALEVVGTLDLGLFSPVLAGDISPDGHHIVLRTPASLWLWHRTAKQTMAEALLENRRCLLPSRFEIYGEAIALDDDGRYLLLGEGLHSPIYLGLPAN